VEVVAAVVVALQQEFLVIILRSMLEVEVVGELLGD
jgi:hypothetical protein